MNRRDFCWLMAAGVALRPRPGNPLSFGGNAGSESSDSHDPLNRSKRTRGQYPNSREPLLSTTFIRLPLGSIRPEGWLRDQFNVQVNGLTSRLGELWDVLRVSAWKGDPGKNVLPECCTPVGSLSCAPRCCGCNCRSFLRSRPACIAASTASEKPWRGCPESACARSWNR